ncbi:MAG: histidine kinase [Bacteroidales bacterium]|nr:histidine kinase [Bacteroidales bacterium]
MPSLVHRIRSNIKTGGTHTFTWLLILFLNYIFLRYYDINFDPFSHILIWLVYVILFYTCYSFLIPVLLFKRKFFIFSACSLILILALYFAIQAIATGNFEFLLNPDKDGHPGIDRNLLLLYGLLLVYFASISTKILLKFKNDEEKKEEIMEKRISTELLYLKQQVNPHFLFNTLNNIYALSIKSPEITPAAILKVSSILRYTLYKSDNSLALLKDEIEIISSYIDFQKMRFKNGLPITYNVSGPIDDFKIEPFILLPLIENAFKYGMVNINDTFINIQITINSDNLKFSIDNRKCHTTESDLEHSGIGIKNIKRRLDLVYPDCHKFKIIDKDEIFSVFMELPRK